MTTVARHSLRIGLALRRASLLAWMALWYAAGRMIGLLVRVLVLGGVAFIQGFADATGWTRVLGWPMRREKADESADGVS